MMSKRKLRHELFDCAENRRPWPDPRYFAAAPTRDQAKRIWWEDLKRMIPRHMLTEDPRESDLLLRTVWGAELRVMGLDKPQRIEGVAWDGGVISEFADCFVSGTLVDTPNGPRAIESLNIGDQVHNAIGVGVVTFRRTKKTNKLLICRLKDGILASSLSHRYLTEQGWKRADELVKGDRLVSRSETMRTVWGDFCTLLSSESSQDQVLLLEMLQRARGCERMLRDLWKVIQQAQTPAESFLFKTLLPDLVHEADRDTRQVVDAGVASNRVTESKGTFRVESGAKETGGRASSSQSLYEIACSTQAVERETQGDWPSTANPLDGQEWFDEAAENVAVESGGRVGIGTLDCFERWREALLLQIRYCESSLSCSGRIGWKFPQQSEGTRKGLSQGGPYENARVEDVEVLESGSLGFSQISHGDSEVCLHDIGVSGHPSFCIGGIVVHNCAPGMLQNNIRPALADRKGWLWIEGVPDRDAPGQIEYKRLYELARSGRDPDWSAYHWPSADIMPAEEIEAMRRTMDAETFRQEIMGEFVLAGGLAFLTFDYSTHVSAVGYDPSLPLCWSLDFNVDPMCSGVIQHHNGHVNVIKEIVIHDTDTNTACEAFIELCETNKWSMQDLKIYGDPSGRARDSTSGRSDWSIVRQRMGNYNASIKVPKASWSIKDTMNAVRGRLRTADGQAHLTLDPSCKQLIRDFESLLWPSDLSEGHCMAWLRYFCEWEYPVKSARPEAFNEARAGSVGVI